MINRRRSVAPPHLPAEDDLVGRVVLRDGTVAALRPTTEKDVAALASFIDGFPDLARRLRFGAVPHTAAALPAQFADSHAPDRAFTLVALRAVDHHAAIVGVGSYVRTNDTTADVAFAVSERAQGNGLATALLERLIVRAAQHGIHVFRATTDADQDAMRDVFRQSGFEQRAVTDQDRVQVELTLVPTAAAVWSAEERERVATATSIKRVLQPRSLAVIGVSREPSAIGRRVFEAIVAGHFTGPVYPVTRSMDEVAGRRTFAAVSEIREPVDVAVIAVPQAAVAPVVDDCAAAGVRGLVIISAGFAEAGPEGRRRQADLVEQVRGYGMRLVGPNCMGVMNAHPDVSLNASFSPIFPPPGRLALMSQSGALGVIVLRLAAERRLGLSSFVSVGNKADVSANDLLQYWESDPETAVVALYLESFGHPQRFSRIARRVSRTKPIVAVKAGRSVAGSRAAGSHTAALAANDAAVTALFRQTGVIRAETIDELLDIASLLESQPLPVGMRVGIVTNAGGPGILAADACVTAGLDVVQFSDRTCDALREFLPQDAGVSNPVDMIATSTAVEYKRTVTTVLSSGDVDALLVLYTSLDTSSQPGIMTAISEGIAAAMPSEAPARPVLVCVMSEDEAPALQAASRRVPVYRFPENAARALGKAAGYAQWRQAAPGVLWDYGDLDKTEARDICRAATSRRGAGWLSPEELQRLATTTGLPLVPIALARTAEEAQSRAVALGLPVVAKMSAAGLVHKTEVGGVLTHLTTAEEVARAFRTLESRAIEHALAFEGIVLQPMVQGGVETMVGVIRDPLFGPLVGFGLGGTSVEILEDVRFRLAPLTDRDVAELIGETRAGRLIAGYRGRPAGDRAGLEELLSRISVLVVAVPEIEELDLNPVLIQPAGQGCQIVDMRVRVKPASDR